MASVLPPPACVEKAQGGDDGNTDEKLWWFSKLWWFPQFLSYVFPDCNTSISREGGVAEGNGLFSIPRVVRGEASSYNSELRCLGQAAERLEMGLCGGPVVEDAASPDGRPLAVGMLEGVVGTARDQALEGMAVFIPAEAILDFCRHVERQLDS